ncbi:MAG TPA: FxsA family protein, partial [Myxococcota bacterium]|nr:FxsA family protein [Myxococcota bacterium]
LLITPGYLSDVVGLVLFIGPVRRFLAPHIKNLAWRWLLQRGLKVGPAAPGPAAPKQTTEPPHFQHPVA